MTSTSRLASAVQIMGFLAHKGDDGSNSTSIARSLATNPVVVRKMLKLLEREGLVSLRRGRQGGVELTRAPEQITIGQIYRAVDVDLALFSLRERVNPRCVISRRMETSLPPLFDEAKRAVENSLNQTSLAQLICSEA